MAKYILRNLTKRDVSLGDLRYTIPAGKSRDLLASGSRLLVKDIQLSRESGSIAKRLQQRVLVEIFDNRIPVIPKAPVKKEVVEQQAIVFPQRTKSFITVEIGDIKDEALLESTETEDADVLRQLELDGIEGTTVNPIVVSADVKTKD